MSDEIKVVMTGDSAGLVAAQDKVGAANTRSVNSFMKLSKAAKEFGDDYANSLKSSHVQMDRLAASAQKWKREIETPAGTHKRTMQELGVLYRMGKLSLDEYTAAVKVSEKAMASATKAGAAGLQAMLGQLSGAAMAFTGVGSAIAGIGIAAAVIRREYQNLLEAQKSAADRQMSTAAAQREALANLGNDPTMSDDQFVKWVKDTHKKTGASENDLYQASSAVLSMKGDVDTRQTLESVEVSAGMNPDDVAAIKENAAAQVNLMTRDKSLRAKDIAGQFLAAKQASPTVTDAAFARNIAPGIAQGVAFGGTARESAALRATIGTGIGDQEGAVTASAAINLEQQLAEVMPDVQGGTIARLKALQTAKYKDARHKFLGAFDDREKSAKKAGLTGEAKAFTTLLELVKGDGTRATELLGANLQKIPDTVGSGKFVDELQQRMMRQPLQQTMALSRGLKGGVESLQLGDVGGAQRSISREGLTETLNSKMSQDIALAEFEAATLAGGQNLAMALGQQLKRKADARLATTQTEIVRTGSFATDNAITTRTIPRTPSAEDVRVGGEIQHMADAILKFAADQQQMMAENNRLLQEQNRLLEGQQGNPGAKPAGVVQPVQKPNTTPPGKPASADRQSSGSMRP